MLSLVGLFCLVFYITSAAPLLSNNNDQKMLSEQSSFQPFNFFNLPVVGKRPFFKVADTPLATNRQLKADLAVVPSAEADLTEPDFFTGYGETKPAEPAPSPDMFVINAPLSSPKQIQEPELKTIGVVPKLTGHLLNTEQKHFSGDLGAAIVNPTAYFLEGANLDKVEKPKCRMIGCDGPLVDDDVNIEQDAASESSEKCYQVFVPIVDAQIRVGMGCRVCCESTALLKELKKTRLQLDFN